jgi:hypothetical protein
MCLMVVAGRLLSNDYFIDSFQLPHAVCQGKKRLCGNHLEEHEG